MSKLEINKGDDFIIGLDISGSMQTADCQGGFRRIDYLLEKLKAFTHEAFKYDSDGVSFYAFGVNCHTHTDLKPEQFDEVLGKYREKLEAATQTHLAINAAYAEHKAQGNDQTFLLLFTDGEPNDQAAVEEAIIRITKEIKDPLEFRIAFITVGQRSTELNAWLTALDDNLTSKGAAHDIVDVKDLDEVDFMAAVAGALTD